MSRPHDMVTELFVTDAWRDISGDVLNRETVSISRGRRNEAGRPEPSKLGLQINNRGGQYSPRNPLSPYDGSLGRNSPLRFARRLVRDTFTRTVSDGWGSTDTGQAWSQTGVGSLSPDDFTVAAGVGTHSVDVPAAYRLSLLGGVSGRDVDVAVTVSLAVDDVTGDQIEPANLVVRGQGVADYLYARVAIEADESVTVDLRHYDDTVIVGPVTVSGLIHSSAQALRVRLQAEAETLRVKVWAEADGEPYGWSLTAHTDRITEPGWVGIRSGVSGSNSNSSPVVFSYDDFEIRSPRIAAEVSSWPPRWDLSGNDRWVPLKAAGIGRRLSQGASPLGSALRRGLLSATADTLVAYWPCEDGRDSTSIASGLPGGAPMHIAVSRPDFAANTDFVASDPLPAPKASYWVGMVPAYTPTGLGTQTRWLLSVPDAGITEQSLVAIRTSGSIATWLVVISATGGLSLRAFNRSGTSVFDSGFFAFAMNGHPKLVSVEFADDGTDTGCNLVTLSPGAATGSQISVQTILGETVGIVTHVQIGSIGDCGIGHVSIHDTVDSIFTLGTQLGAWAGETAGERIERLCAEEDIPFSWIGDLTDTAAMGAQQSATLLTLLDKCADADRGTLCESRGSFGLSYRTRKSLYNQPARLALDYAAAQVSPPFEPVPDDQLVRNDITVTRTGGSSARAVLDTGPLSVAPPPDGIGRYDDAPELNVAGDAQLPDLAGWLLHQGTIDEERYPRITVDLTTPGVVAAGLEPDVLDLDIDDRVTVDNLPAGQPPDQVTQLVRGYEEQVNLFEHRLTANCAPERPYQVIRLDDGVSKLGSATSSLGEDLDTTETAIGVAVSGVLWTTDAGQMPIPIMVGGEEMSVTAISGSSSPQTFTVARSVNGTVKTHSAGDPVRLARRATLAL